MKKLLIIAALFFASCNTQKSNCPDCLEDNCIYNEINANVKGKGSDGDIYNSIIDVCKKRGITDSCTIQLLLREYYL